MSDLFTIDCLGFQVMSKKNKAMKCVICKTGDCLPGTASFTHILKEKLVVVKNVKATICNNCGEAYYDTEAVNYIQAKTKEAIKNNEDVALFTV